jgi:hypothetical protein
MKRLMIFAFIALMFSACTIEHIEPRYDARDRIVGYYDVEEYSKTYHDYTYYDLHISRSAYDDREIYLNNFYASDLRVLAVLNQDRITIPFQVVDGYEIEGVGTVHGNEIDFDYSVKDRYNHSYTDFCETTAKLDY